MVFLVMSFQEGTQQEKAIRTAQIRRIPPIEDGDDESD